MNSKFKLTRIRRDQREVCFTSRAAVVPVPLSTTPALLHKPRARHELKWCGTAKSGRLPSAVGGGHYARPPQTEAVLPHFVFVAGRGMPS